MTGTRDRVDRAVAVLGLVALGCTVSGAVSGELSFRIRGWGLVVTLALGALAVLAGWLALRVVALLAGLGFLAAAAVQIVQLGGEAGAVEHGVLDGNAATFAVWLGLGTGLAVLGLTRGPGRGPET